MSCVLILLSSSPYFIKIIAKYLNVENPPSVLFYFGLIYLLFYNLHITTVFSKHSEKINKLTQEIAIIKNKQDRLSDRYYSCVQENIEGKNT